MTLDEALKLAEQDCQDRTAGGTCCCQPKCAVCGWGPHMAVHQPGRAKDGTKLPEPFDHPYKPKGWQ